MRHLNIKYSFTTERFEHDKPVFVRQMTKIYGTYRHPAHGIGKLLLNLYGTKHSCYIYLEGLDTHLHDNGYIPSEADPCLYHKEVTNGRILIATTVEEFLVTAPTNEDIDTFKHTFATKYRITDLGQPSKFIGWTVKRHATGPIHISEPELIAKALTKAGLADCNPRSTPLPQKPTMR